MKYKVGDHYKYVPEEYEHTLAAYYGTVIKDDKDKFKIEWVFYGPDHRSTGHTQVLNTPTRPDEVLKNPITRAEYLLFAPKKKEATDEA